MPRWGVRVHATSLCHVSCVITCPALVIMSLTPGVQAAQYASYLRIQKLLFGTRVNFFPLPRPQALPGSAGAHTSN